MKRRWSFSAGSRGYAVTACERKPGGTLYLRWWSPQRGNYVWKALGHRDRAAAELEAREIAGTLLARDEAEAKGQTTLADVLARFLSDVVPHGKPAQAKEDRRRCQVLLAAFPGALVTDLDRAALERFVQLRRAGRLSVPGVQLRGRVTERTVGADLEFLRRVLNWGRGVRVSGRKLVDHDPFEGFTIPDTKAKRRPVETWDRFLALRPHADAVHPLFGHFLDLVEATGWRVSALCQLRASDVRLTRSETAPYGALHKRGETDKEGEDAWVPVSERAAGALLALVKGQQRVGDVWLFQAVQDAGAPWSRHYARDLLRRAEQLAGLEPLEGGAFHSYRRKWVTERKAHPLTDIAAAGNWKSTATLLECYMQPDPKTVLAVVTEPRKLTSVAGT